MNLARVFPRRTEATPTDEMAFVGEPPFFLPPIDEVHVSVTWTWDIQEGERIAKAWERIAPVKISGPAFNIKGDQFEPGKYLKHGYTITSRGCPNHCGYCVVPRRSGALKEYEIKDGWILADDNLLACSDEHIRRVFEMLRRQKQRIKFTGGLESCLLKPWHVDLMKTLRIESMYFAYDGPGDLEPLIEAGKLLKANGYKFSQPLYAYVLIGYKDDTQEKAVQRFHETMAAGFMPYAMLYQDEKGISKTGWKPFQREWIKPGIIRTRYKSAHGGR